MRLIDVDKFIETHGRPLPMDKFMGSNAELDSFNRGISFIVRCLEKFETAKPEKHRWLQSSIYNPVFYICECCGQAVRVSAMKDLNDPRFCPHCGVEIAMDDE